MEDAAVKAVEEATAKAIAAAAQAKGLPVTADQVTSISEQASKVLAAFITGALEKMVKGDADRAVAGIDTLEEAEASARRQR